MAEVTFDGVAVSEVDVLPLPPSAWEALGGGAAVAPACDSIGGAAAMLERIMAYLDVRQQFGRPIGFFQALKHRVASWEMLLEVATALVRHAADAIGRRDEGASALASNAKFYACDAYAAIYGDAVQLHGGIGFTWEYPCHLFLKRAKLDQQLFGSSSTHKERVARPAFSGIAQPVDNSLLALASSAA